MIGELISAVASVALAWAIVVAIVSLEAVRRARRLWGAEGSLQRSRARELHGGDPVLLVRPCAGSEPELERALTSLRDARCSVPIRCRFAVASDADTALPAARRALEALEEAGIDAQIVITRASGPNYKAAQLAAAIEREAVATGALVVVDSDVDLTGVNLDDLLAPLQSPEPAGAVWAPPVERGPLRAAGDRASAAVLGGSLHAFPLLAALDERGLVGKLFSIRLDVLRDIGGFGALTRVLGEDIEIARRIRARGGAALVAPFVARSLASGRTWAQAVARYARWLVIIRAQRPWLLLSYPALFFAAPLILALAAASALSAPLPAFAAAALTLAARLLVAWSAARAAGRPTGLASLALDAVLADAVLALAFARALRTRTVVWRGNVLTVDPKGVLESPPDPARRAHAEPGPVHEERAA